MNKLRYPLNVTYNQFEQQQQQQQHNSTACWCQRSVVAAFYH